MNVKQTNIKGIVLELDILEIHHSKNNQMSLFQRKKERMKERKKERKKQT